MASAIPPGPPADLAQTVLNYMRVPAPYKHVYYLGSHASRLTFLSQQQRAFNLVWALASKNLLGARVAVVGAGMSGVTAALAARQAGAAVTLIERKPDVLHLQRGSQLRYIHPNIYDWPAQEALKPTTDLPCLNWGAAMAATVIETILRRWESLRGDIRIVTNVNVTAIEYLGDGDPIVNGEGAVTHRQSYDTVVVAAGFGLETQLSGVPFLSYWENDNFSRPVLADPIPRRYLVTGCGDGGLIDAARLCIRDFDHARFVNQFLEDSSLDIVRQRLPDIDREAAALTRDPKITAQIDSEVAILRAHAAAAGRPFDEHMVREAVTVDLQGRFVHQEYDRLAIPERLTSDLNPSRTAAANPLAPTQSALREDSTVYLNGPHSTPFSLSASILNRFVVFLLRKYGRLTYCAGKVQIEKESAPGSYQVRFQRSGFPDRTLEVHEIVVRHGARSAIQELFGKEVADQLRRPFVDIDDPTRQRCYPANFLANEGWDAFNRQDRLSYAIANMHRAAEKYLQSGKAYRVSIDLHDGEPGYEVFLRQGENVEAGQTIASFPVFFYAQPKPRAEKSAQVEPAEKAAANRAVVGATLHIGMRLGPSRARPQGSLGCFVKMLDGSPALFTSSFTLPESSVGHPVYWHGRAVADLALWQGAAPSPPDATMSAETIVRNRVEGAVAVIRKGVSYHNSYIVRGKELPKIRGVGDAQLGQQVFKVGWVSGLTYGTVSLLGVLMKLETEGGTVWFENLIGIVSGGGGFSKPGDSGAMVITMDGDVLGHIIASSGEVTYLVPASATLAALGCTLLTDI